MIIALQILSRKALTLVAAALLLCPLSAFAYASNGTDGEFRLGQSVAADHKRYGRHNQHRPRRLAMPFPVRQRPAGA